MRKLRHWRSASGQALIEVALLVPFLLAIAFNTVNFGYFFVVATNLTSAPRNAVEYSILGSASVASASGSTLTPPNAGPSTDPTSISYLAYQDLVGALNAPTSSPVQVCAATVGLNNAGTSSQTAACTSYGNTPPTGFSFQNPASDPESPGMILQRVDVIYSFKPLIPGKLFNLILPGSPICDNTGTCHFHRQSSMRLLQ